jgi:lipoprotein-anchoring transpeptidase ErfK/SrfK
MRQESMIRQNGSRFADKDHAAQGSMIRQSGNRFAAKDHAAKNKEAGSIPSELILIERRGTMRRTAFALVGLACAAAAFATPAAAVYTIDPNTHEPIYNYPVHRQRAHRPQRPPAPKSFRSTVDYSGEHAPGTVIVSTRERRLYYVLPDGNAVRYGIGVGRQGFQWSGTETITRKREWPDWRPPTAMLRRRPDLPRYMSGGLGNPLGARALYLGTSEYRIHGSNEPWTIGHAVSSGCIRMTNSDVIDLYKRVAIGTTVVVLR